MVEQQKVQYLHRRKRRCSCTGCCTLFLEHSNQNQMWCVNMGECMLFRCNRGFCLLMMMMIFSHWLNFPVVAKLGEAFLMGEKQTSTKQVRSFFFSL